MKILIAEDDSTNRIFMEKYLSEYGTCDTAQNGLEVINLISESLDSTEHYDLVCLDVMMPKVDGLKTLSIIRDLEKNKKVSYSERSKIVMVSALNDDVSIREAYFNGCNSYACKPVQKVKFDEMLKKLEVLK